MIGGNMVQVLAICYALLVAVVLLGIWMLLWREWRR